MAIANLQAQMANLTSLVSKYVEQTTMQNVPTFEASYRQEYQTNQHPQFFENGGWDGVNAWGYHDYNQSRNDMFSNACNTDWGDHSNLMWEEPQQEEYWQPYEEFYFEPMQPTQFPPQFAQPQSGTSLDNDEFIQLLTSVTQGMQNQAKEVGELKKQMGQLVECMGQIQEESELSSSTIDNSMGEFEIVESITFRRCMEVGAEPETSMQSLQVDSVLLFEEEDQEQPLPQPSHISKPPNLGKVVPIPSLSNPIPPNIPFPFRFLQSTKEEGEKDILETFPSIEVKEVAVEYQVFIKKEVLETSNPEEVGFDDTGQVTHFTPNLLKCKVPETFNDVVFVLEFISEHMGTPSSRISILFYPNLLLMIQAPTPELRSLPDHFKYHRPFKDQHHAKVSHEV